MSPQSVEVLRLINRISLLHRVRVQKFLSDTGVWGSQIPILLHVERNPGCSQTDIAAHLGVSSPSIATSIKRLQKAGMLEKTADAADMRRNHITLTDRGQRTVAEGRSCYEQVTGQMLGGLSDEEIAALGGLLRRLEGNLAGTEYQDKNLFCLAVAANEFPKSAKEECEDP